MPDEAIMTDERTALLAEIQSLRSENEKLQRELAIARSEAATDDLTGLPNRVVAKMELDKTLAEVSRGQKGIAVIFIDADSFKSINDTYGHPQGDNILKQLARVLKDNIRGGDFIGRLSGEEFLGILNLDLNQDESQVKPVLDRLKEEAAKINRTGDGTNFNKLTLSIGCLVIPPDSNTSSNEAIRLADALMYQSKSTGKDKYTISSL